MGNPAGVKRDFRVLEQRRFAAARLFEQGAGPGEVARRLGVHRQSGRRWRQQWEEEGRAGLKRAGRAGRKPQLSRADRERIKDGLKRGPEALGYGNGLWTAARVAELIRRACGVTYTTVHAWRILGQLGWSCQRPVGRAKERDEAAIRRWKKQRWPVLKKTPKQKGERSFSSTRAD